MDMPQRSDVIVDDSTVMNPDVALLRRGDRRATETALLSLVPLVRKWLYRLLGPSDLLDDATQEALTEISCSLHRFKGNCALPTFAHRITVRCAYRYFSKPTSIRVNDSIDEIAETGDDPEASTANRQLLRRIYRCLDILPKKKRVAFILCAVEGHSPSEAAQIVGTLPVTMRSRLKRAREEVLRLVNTDETILNSIERRRGGCV